VIFACIAHTKVVRMLTVWCLGLESWCLGLVWVLRVGDLVLGVGVLVLVLRVDV